jgi:hypothetical protein
MRIRDGDSSDPGSGMKKSRIRDKHPGSATLLKFLGSEYSHKLYNLKVPSHQDRLGLNCYSWIGLGEYKDGRW